MDNVIVRLVDLPRTVRAFVSPDAEGDYNVYINERLSDEDRRVAFEHELTHISAGHLYAGVCAADCEESIKKEPLRRTAFGKRISVFSQKA